MAHTFRFLLAAAFAVSAGAAHAQGPCMPRDAVVDRLDSVYAEKLLAGGLRGATAVIEIFMSENGKSWTVVQSYANGVSCIIAAGTDWHQNDPAVLFAVEG